MQFSQWFENMSEKKLYIMRGTPGSGKSYTAEQLGQGGVVFSTDDFFGQGEEYLANFAKAQKEGTIGTLLGRYHKMNQDRAIEAMKKGVTPIVIDNTNVKKREMRPYVEAGVAYDYDVEFVEPTSKWWLEISKMLRNRGRTDAEIRRAAEKLAGRTLHGVPAQVIERMLKNFHLDPKVEDF
jgi:predicted kinase